MVLEHVGLEPEIRQHQEFVEKSCGGQLSNHFQPTIIRKSRAGQLFPTQLQEILWKTINSWKTLAWPMFSMNFHEKTMENIGQANVFHEFIEFHRFLAGPRRFSGKPQIHGKHWPGQCFPLLFDRNSWKTLARPMFSMNFWFFLDSWLIPGDSLENHKFMENIGQANVFHEFP